MRKEIRVFLASAVLLGLFMLPTAAWAIFSGVDPVDLRCEYLKNPLGLDVKNPRLFWKLEAKDQSSRGLSQRAYRIEVASSERLLKLGQADLWDSGIVRSSDTTQIEYEGEALRYPMNCWWRVRVSDQAGNWSNWSEPAFWTVGPMREKDWNAEWVGTDEVFVPSKDMAKPEPSMANPWIRKTYELQEIPASALMYVASCGYHELYINGVRVGDEVLSPSVSDLSKRALYKTYNIASYLQQGKNSVVIWLGVGWGGYVNYETANKPRTPMVLAQADLVFNSRKGKKETQWVTDSTWKTHPSPSYLLGIWMWPSFGGELYDATKELEGWSSPELDDSSWKAVKVYTPGIKVSANRVEGNRLIGTLKPVSVEKLDSGLVKIDMGCNYTGWLRFKMKGAAGQRVNMRWSERPDKENTFFLTSSYIFGDSGEGTFEHRFNYATGRWIYVDGLDYLPEVEDISGYVINTDYERAGSFKSDNELFNRIYDTALWTFENLSLGGYVVDCPHRERMGYGGDGSATLNMGMGNFGLGALYYKWAADWRDVQREDGWVPYTAPTYWGGGGPAWSGFIIYMPWEVYLQYGDKRVLEETYPAMQRWLGFLEKNSKDGILVPWGPHIEFLGDWLRPGFTGGTPEEDLCLNNCYWVYNLELAAKVADVLGLSSDADTWRGRAAEVREATNGRFLNPEEGTYASGLQAYQAMALLAGIPTEEMQKEAWKRLEEDILQTRNGHIHAGITGGAFLFKALQDAGRNDLIYPMVAARDYPSWGDMLSKGATTFWEDWEGDGSKNHSFLHSSYLYVGNWFIEGLGGIRAPRESAHRGFRHFVIEPGYQPGEKGLTRVESSYDSIAGKIVSNWEVRHHKMFAKVVVPPNCTAEMKFPVSLENVFESAEPVTNVKGIQLKDLREQSLILSSGTYFFEVWLK